MERGRRQGRAGEEGKVEKREVSGILFLCAFLFVSVSETAKARPRCAALGHKAESASLTEETRDSSGSQNSCLQPRPLTMQRRVPHQTGRTRENTHSSANTLPPTTTRPSRSVFIPLTQPLSPSLSPAPCSVGGLWGEVRACLAPLCTTNEVAFPSFLLRGSTCSENSITYNGPHSAAVDARGESFLDVTDNGRNEAISQTQQRLASDESPQIGLDRKGPNATSISMCVS